jgi:hypothetical protein
MAFQPPHHSSTSIAPNPLHSFAYPFDICRCFSDKLKAPAPFQRLDSSPLHFATAMNNDYQSFDDIFGQEDWLQPKW